MRTIEADASADASARLCALVCVLVVLTGCADSPTPVIGCEASADITPDCRFQNPEDIAPYANGFLVSQMSKGETAGSLAYYDVEDSNVFRIFPSSVVPPTDAMWGDSACQHPDESKFAPHGLDLDERADGKQALYVVNHGGRESIEMFEVSGGDGVVTTTWRGCVLGPEHANFNDVVGLDDGGFWTTQMFAEPDAGTWALIKGIVFHAKSGWVYAWHPGAGWSKLEGTDTAFPNGIEKAPDESVVYVNSYFGSTITKFDVATGEALGSADVETPDNVTWSSDGKLLVASHTDSYGEIMTCGSLTEGSCGYEFEIVAIDPETMQQTPVLGHRGAPMGGATVAAERNGWLYLGTFAGDRISRWRWRE
jgi:sugar lactone lactonase YvrE